MACVTCNSGWMEALETLVRGIITPMIAGKDARLGIEPQVAIATWAVKTAMVMEFLRRRDVKYFSRGERRSLMKATRPPTLLGAHGGSHDTLGTTTVCAPQPRVLCDRRAGSRRPTAFFLALRQFMVQVFVERGSAGQGIYVRPGAWSEALVEIWPPTGEATWPPRLAFDEDGVRDLLTRFLAPGTDSHVYGFRRMP
jgi:hypothetical protein